MARRPSGIAGPILENPHHGTTVVRSLRRVVALYATMKRSDKMMICKAEIEELFPELFRPSDMERSVAEPSAKCLARWEDNGGRTTSTNIIPLPHRRPMQKARRDSVFEVRSRCPLTSKSASWTSSTIRLLHLCGICASLSVPIPARSRRLTGCSQRLRSPHGHARKPFPVPASEPPGSPGGLRISAPSTTRGFLTSLHLRTRALPLRETYHDNYQDHPPACRQWLSIPL